MESLKYYNYSFLFRVERLLDDPFEYTIRYTCKSGKMDLDIEMISQDYIELMIGNYRLV